MLRRLHDNDTTLAAELLQDPGLRHRNRVALDWGDAWRLNTGEPGHVSHEGRDVTVRFAAQIPVRPVKLIAEGCGLSRSEVDRLIAEGKVVSTAKLGAASSPATSRLLSSGSPPTSPAAPRPTPLGSWGCGFLAPARLMCGSGSGWGVLVRLGGGF